MSKVFDHMNDKAMFDVVPTMSEVEYELSVEKDLKEAEDLLRKIESNSNPAYIKELVDKYFENKEEEK
jgi:hypothetical protein